MKRFGIIASICFLIGANSTLAAKFINCINDENVISENIEGRWKTDQSLSDILGGKPDTTIGSIEITSDLSVVPRFENHLQEMLERDNCFYFAGKMSVTSETHDNLEEQILLFSHKGNSGLLWFKVEPDGRVRQNGFTVMLAKGRTPMNDLLFIGVAPWAHYPMVGFRRQ